MIDNSVRKGFVVLIMKGVFFCMTILLYRDHLFCPEAIYEPSFKEPVFRSENNRFSDLISENVLQEIICNRVTQVTSCG